MQVNEKNFVIDSFRKNFSKDEKIVIYGLGKNTREVLNQCSEYNIVGLMDGIRTGENEWGLPILSIDEVNKLGVKKIVVIATSANVSIIFKRIEKSCTLFGIEVYDINGNRIESEKQFVLKSDYLDCTEEKLKREIDECDVVSFDIFDTLLVRKTLYPTDIFDMVFRAFFDSLKNVISDFVKQRIGCERRLYLTTHPNIYDIYNEIQKDTRITNEVKNSLIEEEIKIEKSNLIVRKRMVSILRYALSQKKVVCCTSDMYLTESILRDFLVSKGILGIDRLFISCELGVSKNSGLFDYVKKHYAGKKILHIGDNYDADIESANRYKIDSTFWIPSIFSMISEGTSKDILSYDLLLSDRLTIGKLFSEVYNDPFLFYVTKGKCMIPDDYYLGYYFVEPIIASFIDWMLEKTKKDNIKTVLLGARDGYIIEKMLYKREEYYGKEIEYKYFYASRYICTLAGMKNDDDVKYAFSMAFDGSAEELLIRRFALEKRELLPWIYGETKEQYLDKHINIILNKAEVYRNKYRDFISKLNIQEDCCGFFDFVSSGTCQLWLEKIYPEIRWKGYYFLRNYDEYKANLNINSFFDSKYVYERQNHICKNYIFMENIMTSYEASLKGLSDDGTLLFGKENRTSRQIESVKDIHKGILDAYEERLYNNYATPSRDLADEILNILNGKYSKIKACFFENNYLEDDYCNRQFDLKDVVEEA